MYGEAFCNSCGEGISETVPCPGCKQDFEIRDYDPVAEEELV